MKRTAVLFSIVLIIVVIAAGCGTPKQEDDSNRYAAEFFDCFDTPITVTAYCDSQEEFDKLSEEIHKRFQHYHYLFDIYNEYDGMINACSINKAAGSGEDIKVDEDLWGVVNLGKYMWDHTKNSVNIGMGAVLSLWHNARGSSLNDASKAYVPGNADLERAGKHCNMEKLNLDYKSKTVRIDDPEMSLDLSSIGIGYAVQKVADWLKEEGKTGILISAGGHVMPIGGKSSNSKSNSASEQPWLVSIENPAENANKPYYDQVYLQDKCLVTSSINRGWFEVDGKKYNQIIDGFTLFPEDRYLSVSVIYTDSDLADPLATALYNMDIQEGKDFVEATMNMEALWVLPGGNVTVSSGWANFRKK